MPTTTKTIPNRIRTAHAAMVREALRTWRRWAAEAATDGTIPSPAELISTAAILGIRDAGTALEDDAAALREHAIATRAAAGCEAAVAEAVEPWGTIETLQAAIEAAERELERLRGVRDYVVCGGSHAYWSFRLSDIHRTAKRVLASEQEYLATLSPEEL